MQSVNWRSFGNTIVAMAERKNLQNINQLIPCQRLFNVTQAVVAITLRKNFKNISRSTPYDSPIITRTVAVIVVALALFKLLNRSNKERLERALNCGHQNVPYMAWKTARQDIFIKYPLLPKNVHHEAVCSITQLPVRYPVRDQYNHLYEEPVIRAWLKKHSFCPLNNMPLTESDLFRDETVAKIIDKQLNWWHKL